MHPKKSMPSVTIIGAGNVGTHLAAVLHQRGFIIRQVFSRHLENAENAARLSGGMPINRLTQIDDDSDLYILAVKDAVIAELSQQLRLSGLVVHTSGTLIMGALSSISSHIGVFYPLQTFTKERMLQWQDIPIFIEAVHPDDLEILKDLALALSANVVSLDSEKRKRLHLAAVFVNNFCNHLLGIASEIMAQEHLDFNLMQSLALETIQKAFVLGPQKAQTGPARRGDKQTMTTQIEMLSDSLQKGIYQIVSASIQGLIEG